MAAVVAISLFMGLFCRISLVRFRWDGPIVKFHSYLYGLSVRGQLRSSLMFLRQVMIVWCVFTMSMNQVIYLVMLVWFGILYGLMSGSIRRFLVESVNTVLLLCGFYAGGLLTAYMREIQYENTIMAVYILLGSFMLLYSSYFFFRDIRTISEGRLTGHVETEKKRWKALR
jgi:hypothetical protein